MNSRLVDLALKKQRLQFKSAALREQWIDHARGIQPLCDGADRVRQGAHWLGRHPEVLVGAAVALLVARPRTLWRWMRRGVLALSVLRRRRHWLLGGLLP